MQHAVWVSPRWDPMSTRMPTAAVRPACTIILYGSTEDAEICQPIAINIDRRPIEFACECD